MKIDLDVIKERGSVPRVHGNGFLQLDVTKFERLHVWGHPDLPRQVVDTGIHNHRFDFRSTVLVGRVFNVTYDVDDLDNVTSFDTAARVTHIAHIPRVRDGEDTILEPHHGVIVGARPHARLVQQGSCYFMSGPAFHETVSDRPSATLMEKADSRHPDPFVLVPRGSKPDNDFNRNSAMPTDHLWQIIHEVLGY